MLDITEELKNYIDLVSVDLYSYFIWYNNNLEHLKKLREHYNTYINYAEYKTENIDVERRKNIKTAIVALIKIYKNISLTEEESLLLDKYPLENTSDDIENKIACIVYKISKEAREEVNKIRLNLDTYSKPVINWIFKIPLSEMFREYLDRLDEYNEDLLNAWLGNSKLYLFSPNGRKRYSPSFDFDSDCFVVINSNKIKLFLKKLRKR